MAFRLCLISSIAFIRENLEVVQCKRLKNLKTKLIRKIRNDLTSILAKKKLVPALNVGSGLTCTDFFNLIQILFIIPYIGSLRRIYFDKKVKSNFNLEIPLT